MDLRRLSGKVKDIVDKRGGTESVKEDAAELQGIAKGKGSLGDKAKAAAGAIKEPGAGGSSESAADEASGADRERAAGKVRGEGRGKHRHADQPRDREDRR